MLLNRISLLGITTLASLSWASLIFASETAITAGEELDAEQPVLLEIPEEPVIPDTQGKSEAETVAEPPAAAPEPEPDKGTPQAEPAPDEIKADPVAEKKKKQKKAQAKREKAAGAIDSARSGKDKNEAPEEIAIASEPAHKRAPFELLGESVAPASIRHLGWQAGAGFGILDEPTPVLVVHGKDEGPVLCLTGAVHGDEINGIDVVRRVIHGLKPEELQGTVVGVPIVNIPGFRRSSRYLPDRRDLNRYFPGDAKGSLASRIAHSFFNKVILSGCHLLVDVHTGSFHRSNLPQLRADLRDSTIADMVHGFGDISVLQSIGARGTLRRAAAEAGVPSVTIETGEPLRLQPSEVARGVKGIEALMSHLGMTRERRLWRIPQPIYYESRWQRVQRGGILFSKVKLGDRVSIGDVLGTVTDPITNKGVNIVASYNGRVLGRALNQFVMPGFAAFHIGIESSQEELINEIEPEEEASTPAGDVTSETVDNDRPERLPE